MVLAASPSLDDDALVKATTLLYTLHELVLKLRLRPCVRSTYLRTAFQSSKSNSLRLTVDRNVTLIDETSAPAGSWCLPDDAVVHTSMTTKVPFPVFEVKLAGSDMPASIQALIDTV